MLILFYSGCFLFQSSDRNELLYYVVYQSLCSVFNVGSVVYQQNAQQRVLTPVDADSACYNDVHHVLSCEGWQMGVPSEPWGGPP
jgi:hypothetical protein